MAISNNKRTTGKWKGKKKPMADKLLTVNDGYVKIMMFLSKFYTK